MSQQQLSECARGKVKEWKTPVTYVREFTASCDYECGRTSSAVDINGSIYYQDPEFHNLGDWGTGCGQCE